MTATRFSVRRLPANPVIKAGMDTRIGTNIQGPSVIRVPDWVRDPLGRFYMYFADHKGDFIRLAHADAVEGPWRVHTPGSLTLADSLFPTVPREPGEAPPPPALPGIAPPGTPGIEDALVDATLPHIASPDVHVDDKNRRIVMYFHGLSAWRTQRTRAALSTDGIRFEARPELFGPSYFRVFPHGGAHYALAMPGILFRSADGLAGFEQGPTLFEPRMRHAALLKRGDDLFVFWTRVTDAPERILVSRIDLRGDWRGWRDEPAAELMRPEQDWEGADCPVAPSWRSAINMRANQLRDPCILEDEGRTWLFYAVAGEGGIGLAELLG